MPQLGKLDLQLAFMAVRTLGEDVQDQPGTINDPAFQVALQVALLHRAELMVHQHQIGASGIGGSLHFLQLAAADQGGGVRPVHARTDGRGNARPGRARQIGELLQYIFFQPANMRLDQQRMFALLRAVKHAPPPAYSLSISSSLA